MARVFLGLGVLAILGGLAAGVYFFKTYLERDARFRIAGTENIQATGLTEVSRAADAARLRRRHRPQHLLRPINSAASSLNRFPGCSTPR